MKERILSALKTRYSHLGFGKEALDGVAAALAKSVADESQIETAVSGVEDLLRVFQSDADRARTEYNALKGQLEQLKADAEASSAAGGGQGKKDEPDIQKMIEDAIAAQVTPLQEKLSAYEVKEAKDARSAMIERMVKELGISDERAKEGFSIPDDMDEAGIKTYLSMVREHEVARGLPGGGHFPLSGNGEVSKEEADSIAAKMC